MYYPPNKIKSNLYTNGNEFIISSNKLNYVGFYFSTFDGKYFTGKSLNDGNNEELIKSSTSNSKDYVVVGNLFYRSIKSKDKTINKLSEYSIPKAKQNIPTQNDYDKGNFIRYFVKFLITNAIIEVDKNTFNDIRSNTIYNTSLYETISIPWQISGPSENSNKNGILIKSVKTINSETVKNNNILFSGLSSYIRNFTEYYK